MKWKFILFMLFLIGCNNYKNIEVIESSGEIIRWEEESRADLKDFIEDIEIIPIDWKDIVVSDLLSLNIEGGEYFIADKRHRGKIYRIDAGGNIINIFGNFGRGPNEYLEIKNMIVDQYVHVFSDLNHAEYVFSKTGELIERIEIPFSFQGIMKTHDGCWLYLGYRNDDIGARLIKTDYNWNILHKYLSTAKIISTTEDAPVLVSSSNGFLIREMVNNSIYEIKNDSLFLAYALDFGKYTIPEEFFKFAHPEQSVQFLIQRDQGSIRRILNNEEYFFAESFLIDSDKKSGIINYIIKQKATNKITQINYSLPDELNNILPNSGEGKFLTADSDLFLLVEPRILQHLKNSSPDFLKLVINPEVIDILHEEGNQVIMKCKLL